MGTLQIGTVTLEKEKEMQITGLFRAPISVSDGAPYLLMNCQGSLVRSDRGSAPKAEHFIKTQTLIGETR